VIVVAALLYAGLHLVLNRSAVGRRLRATAEDREMAAALGIRVERVLALAFALAGASAGAAGLLLANSFFATPGDGSNYMVKAYIAAAIGGWGRIGGAALGAVMIALFEVLLPALPTLLPAWLTQPIDWLFSQTAAAIMLYASLLAILVLRPMGLFGERGRAACMRRWLESDLNLPAAVGAALLALWPFLFDNAYDHRLMALAGAYALMALGYQFIFGHAGQLALTQATFFGLGAYTTGILSQRLGWDGAATLALSILVPGAVALLAAMPLVRLKSHYFALATLAVAQTVLLIVVQWRDLTGGSNGIAGVPGLIFFGWSIPSGLPMLALIWLMVAILAGLPGGGKAVSPVSPSTLRARRRWRPPASASIHGTLGSKPSSPALPRPGWVGRSMRI